MGLDGKLAMIDEYLPVIEPDATPEQLESTRRLMAAVRGSRGGRYLHARSDKSSALYLA